jgi:hypothetical protein
MRETMKSQTILNFAEAVENLGPRVRQAYELSTEALARLAIPHIVVGGIAVCAYGHARSVNDVDYLVLTGDVFEGDVVRTLRPGVPFKVSGVAIDYCVERDTYPLEVRDAMRECVAEARERGDKSGIVPDWLLVWMKLCEGRHKDVADVEGLVRAGLDVAAVRANLPGPERVRELFERCVAAAEGETRGT